MTKAFDVGNDDAVASKIECLLDRDGLRTENLGMDLHVKRPRERNQPVQAFEIEDSVFDVEHDASETEIAGDFDHGGMRGGQPDRKIGAAGHAIPSSLRSRPAASSIIAVAPDSVPSRSPRISASLKGISSACSSSA